MSAAAGKIEVAFGLGSNLGDKHRNIARAMAALEATGLVEGLVGSSLYRTEPWGPVTQDWYVNACAVGVTDLPPRDLLPRIKALETALGRVKTVYWGPRVIDIDILYHGEAVLTGPALTLPHPGLLIRPFVLIPLAELRPDRRIGGRRIGDAAAAVDAAGVERLG